MQFRLAARQWRLPSKFWRQRATGEVERVWETNQLPCLAHFSSLIGAFYEYSSHRARALRDFRRFSIVPRVNVGVVVC